MKGSLVSANADRSDDQRRDSEPVRRPRPTNAHQHEQHCIGHLIMTDKEETIVQTDRLIKPGGYELQWRRPTETARANNR